MESVPMIKAMFRIYQNIPVRTNTLYNRLPDLMLGLEILVAAVGGKGPARAGSAEMRPVPRLGLKAEGIKPPESLTARGRFP